MDWLSVQWTHNGYHLLGYLPNMSIDSFKDGFDIIVTPGKVNRGYNAEELAECAFKDHSLKWLQRRKKEWIFYGSLFLKYCREFSKINWLHETYSVIPRCSIKEVFDEDDAYHLEFPINPEFDMQIKPSKIFISHKSSNKPTARRLAKALKAAGFKPWLDEDNMAAGVELERELLKGLEESCAAVFLITSDYQDDGYLASEVNYAISEKRKKGADFSLIVLVTSEKGVTDKIPKLLRQYVWKECSSEIDAFSELLRALPIKPGTPIWK